MKHQILKSFYENFPELIESMKNTNHNYDNENLNPYHLEGDVWTHTMMVYSQVQSNSIAVLLAALLHDIGKPQVHKRNSETNRVHFFCHEGMSFYKAIDVLKHPCFDYLLLTDANKQIILKLIALHTELFSWKNSNNIDARFRNDQSFLNLLAEVVECDYNGRLSTSDNPKQTWKHLITSNYIDEKQIKGKDQKVITILIGPSNSGKSTYCESITDNSVRISRDDIVLELGKIQGKSNYTDCWKAVDQQEVDHKLMFNYQIALRNNEDIIVDLTNLSKKSRRKWLNDTKIKRNNYWKRAIVFCAGEQDILERAKKQKDVKDIPEAILYRMMSQLAFPLYAEFDEIEFA